MGMLGEASGFSLKVTQGLGGPASGLAIKKLV